MALKYWKQKKKFELSQQKHNKQNQTKKYKTVALKYIFECMSKFEVIRSKQANKQNSENKVWI